MKFVKKLVTWVVFVGVLLSCAAVLPAAAPNRVREGRSTVRILTREGPVNHSRQRFDCYCVRPGDTLSEVAGQYGITVMEIEAENHITNPNSLQAGEMLSIPLGPPVPGNPLAAGSPVYHCLSWPVQGPVSSPFGWRTLLGKREMHEGIDIAASQGAPIRVVLAGRVVFAAPRGTYGLCIIISHGDGFSTLYAHASQILVSEGMWVNRGEVIALVGETGEAFGPHLHFEVHVNGQAVNPEEFLQTVSE